MKFIEIYIFCCLIQKLDFKMFYRLNEWNILEYKGYRYEQAVCQVWPNLMQRKRNYEGKQDTYFTIKLIENTSVSISNSSLWCHRAVELFAVKLLKRPNLEAYKWRSTYGLSWGSFSLDKGRLGKLNFLNWWVIFRVITILIPINSLKIKKKWGFSPFLQIRPSELRTWY